MLFLVYLEYIQLRYFFAQEYGLRRSSLAGTFQKSYFVFGAMFVDPH